MKDNFLLTSRILSYYVMGGFVLQMLMIYGLVANPVPDHFQEIRISGRVTSLTDGHPTGTIALHLL